ncbi:OmpH family outer membrane protein [Psychromonas sp. MME2]|uniref:OmpH family outer membrane protein n=1 Tax=Psychromonas sp. MME2 TaxID=3231033 RepID=UPI00339CB895
MNMFFKAVTLAVALTSVSTFSAAEKADKIAVVFPSKIMQQTPQRERIIKQLEKEFKGRYEELQKLGKEISTLETTLNRDAEMMAESDLTSMQRNIEVKVSEYKLKRKAFEEDNRRRQGEEQQKALNMVRDVINAVAEKEGYDLF